MTCGEPSRRDRWWLDERPLVQVTNEALKFGLYPCATSSLSGRAAAAAWRRGVPARDLTHFRALPGSCGRASPAGSPPMPRKVPERERLATCNRLSRERNRAPIDASSSKAQEHGSPSEGMPSVSLRRPDLEPASTAGPPTQTRASRQGPSPRRRAWPSSVTAAPRRRAEPPQGAAHEAGARSPRNGQAVAALPTDGPRTPRSPRPRWTSARTSR